MLLGQDRLLCRAHPVPGRAGQRFAAVPGQHLDQMGGAVETAPDEVGDPPFGPGERAEVAELGAVELPRAERPLLLDQR